MGNNITVDSNTVTAAAGAALAPVKTQSATLLFPGDTQTYTITATNVVGIILNSVTFTDTIPTGLTFVPGSFKVNGVVKTPTISGQNLSYTVTDAWAIGATLTITFQCTRNS